MQHTAPSLAPAAGLQSPQNALTAALELLGAAGIRLQPAAMPDRLLKIEEVCELVGFGHTWVNIEATAGRFPTAIKFSERAVRFKQSEILAWIARQSA
jgi:predicted DNA-binding transcriptional regulator AlpA